MRKASNVHCAPKVEGKKPFPQAAELTEKTKRLVEPNILLNMDKRDTEIVDGDISEEEPSGKATKEMER